MSLKVPEEDEEEDVVPPLNEPYPFKMRPFPFTLIKAPAMPPEKADLGIPIDSDSSQV